MALQLFREIELPSSRWTDRGGYYSGFQINGAAEKVGFVLPVPETGTISKVGFRTAVCAVSDALKVSLQSVGADGNPSGTLLWTNASSVESTPAATTSYVKTLTASGSVTKGDKIAVVVEFNSYVAGDLFITACNTREAYPGQFPYATHYTTSWAKSQYSPFCLLVYDVGGVDTCYPIAGVRFSSTQGTRIFHVDTATYDEYGTVLSYPFPLRVKGWWGAYYAAAGANHEVIVYTGTTPITELTATMDGDLTVSTGDSYITMGYFPSVYSLAKDTDYRVAIRPTTTANIGLAYVTFDAAAHMGIYPGGSTWCGTKRLNQGAWTDETTTRYFFGLIADQLDDGVSAGGGDVAYVGIRGAGLKVEHNVFE